MSKDGYLPDNVSESDPDAPWNQGDHSASCPMSEDAIEKCTCGHDLEGDHVLGVCRIDGCVCVEAEKAEAVCICAELGEAAESAAADAAESRAEERRLGT